LEAFIAAYTSQDAAGMAATCAGEQQIEFKVPGDTGIIWTSDHMQKDSAFSAGVSDEWQIDGCFVNFGRVECLVNVEDELGRRAEIGPAAVRFFYTVEGTQWTKVVWDAFDAWDLVHVETHRYGDWYEATYPDHDPIQGPHYRGWNVDDPTAPDRYMESLDEYLDS